MELEYFLLQKKNKITTINLERIMYHFLFNLTKIHLGATIDHVRKMHLKFILSHFVGNMVKTKEFKIAYDGF